MNAKLRRWEEVFYKQKIDARQRCFKEVKVARKVVQEQQNVEAEMTRIKKVVGALSMTFTELIVQPKDSVEVAVQ